MSEYDKEKLSYVQYNRANMAKFMPDYATPMRNTESNYNDLRKDHHQNGTNSILKTDPNDTQAYNKMSLEDLEV